MSIVRCLLVFVCICVKCVFAQNERQFPENPKDQGQELFVSNPDGILSSGVVAELNSISQEIEQGIEAEYAIVVINNFPGSDLFEYAFDLFNTWGIGKKDKNNGLLLVVAKDRREYRFVSGYGLEAIFPDIYLKRIGERYLVPDFKNEDYSSGVLNASQIIKQVLLAPDTKAELERSLPSALPFFHWKNPMFSTILYILISFFVAYLWIKRIGKRYQGPMKKKVSKSIHPFWGGVFLMFLLMFFSLFVFLFLFNSLEKVYQLKNLPYFIAVFCSLVLFVHYTDQSKALMATYKDEALRQQALRSFVKANFLPMLLTPFSWFIFYNYVRRFAGLNMRLIAPDNIGDWVRLSRDEPSLKIKNYLSSGQIKEESIGSKTYEIWIDKKTGKRKLVSWEGMVKGFVNCEKCHFKTKQVNLSRTHVSATYTREGRGDYYNRCQNCGLEEVLGDFIIPKLTRSSSSSSGGGSSNSGGGSRGGGSFGGGSSGGGGAGGRW
ncbi:TPM domain-containing protein [Sphingobacterium sp. UT-1RO-CII-1]|nr:TPM domain-containing protein [Sphingobacterium sp. UT-1RO-CII-1]